MGKKSNEDSTSDNDGPTNKVVSSSNNLGFHLAQTAWRIALPFLVFAIGGIMLDRALGTEPIFSMVGLGVALLAVTVIVYKYVDSNFPGTFGGSE